MNITNRNTKFFLAYIMASAIFTAHTLQGRTRINIKNNTEQAMDTLIYDKDAHFMERFTVNAGKQVTERPWRCVGYMSIALSRPGKSNWDIGYKFGWKADPCGTIDVYVNKAEARDDKEFNLRYQWGNFFVFVDDKEVLRERILLDITRSTGRAGIPEESTIGLGGN